MSLILTDHVAGNVTFTLASADSKGARYIAQDLSSSTESTEVVFSVDKPVLGSKASRRLTVKSGHEILAAETNTVSKSTCSILSTLPPGTSLAQAQNDLAYAVSAALAEIETMYAGIIPHG